MTGYEILWYFLIYSFVGWIVEVAYHGAVAGVIVNRGFLNGPVCPVYGCGVLSVLGLMQVLPERFGQPGAENLLVVFMIGMIFATFVELVAGWAMDRLFHARWWDYSDRPLNWHGYICLSFSILWGMGITFVIRIWHPEVTGALMKLLQPKWGWWMLLAFYILFAVDVIVSAAVTIGLNKKLESLDRAREALRVVSDELSDRIGSESLKAMQNLEEGQVQAALAKAELRQAVTEKREELVQAVTQRKEARELAALERREELEAQIEKLRKHLTGPQARRILRAFPNMKHREHGETLEALKKRIRDRIR
ncbi:MAG: hypothetical protein Q4B59_03185 [Lachnospiraceae bacterium]|nr:hypothetical protein [Lachnospiraceae bacterium]